MSNQTIVQDTDIAKTVQQMENERRKLQNEYDLSMRQLNKLRDLKNSLRDEAFEFLVEKCNKLTNGVQLGEESEKYDALMEELNSPQFLKENNDQMAVCLKKLQHLFEYNMNYFSYVVSVHEGIIGAYRSQLEQETPADKPPSPTKSKKTARTNNLE